MFSVPSCGPTERRQTPRPTKARHRQGIAASEFAILAPFLFFLVMGIFEMSRAIMIKEILSNAARKGCSKGIIAGKTYSDITTEVNDIMTDMGINTSQVTTTIQVATYSGSGTNNTPTWGTAATVTSSTFSPSACDQISVKVSVPVTSVLWFTPVFMPSSSVESETIVMLRQG